MACWLIEKLNMSLLMDCSVNLGIEKEAIELNPVTRLSPIPLLYLYR